MEARVLYGKALEADPTDLQARLGKAEVEARFKGTGHVQAYNNLQDIRKQILQRNEGRSIEEYSRADQLALYRAELAVAISKNTMANDFEYVKEDNWVMANSYNRVYDRAAQDGHFTEAIAAAKEAERIAGIIGIDSFVKSAQASQISLLVSQHASIQAHRQEWDASKGYFADTFEAETGRTSLIDDLRSRRTGTPTETVTESWFTGDKTVTPIAPKEPLSISEMKVLDAAELANYASGVVVGKVGTATPTIEEIKKHMEIDER